MSEQMSEGRKKFNKWAWVGYGSLVVIAFTVQFFSGDKDKSSGSAPQTQAAQPAAPKPQAFPQDIAAAKLMADPNLYGGLCEKLTDINVFDRIVGTASANNHPAHIVGMTFNCVDNFGTRPIKMYIGWMENQNTQKFECVHWNAERDRVIADGWFRCGGNFQIKG